MVKLSKAELAAIRAAKAKYQKYQYGSLYHKSAHKTYVMLVAKLAELHQCTTDEIQSAEKEQL